MRFLSHNRVVRDLLLQGFIILGLGIFAFVSGVATEFVVGVMVLCFGLGVLYASIWVEVRIMQLERMAR